MGQKNSFADIRTPYPGKNCFSSVFIVVLMLLLLLLLFFLLFLLLFFKQFFLLFLLLFKQLLKLGHLQPSCKLQFVTCSISEINLIDSGAFFGIKNAICKQIKRNTILSIIHLLLVRFERNLLCIIVTCVEKVSRLYFH